MRIGNYRLLLLAGYAIIDDAAFPIVGDPKKAYDTYLEQLVEDARAAVDTAVGTGVVDRDRIGVTGHSHGALMTANLIAHTDLFRAGVATSGSYNKTLTPFGFQNERRSVWKGQGVYLQVSPFFFADKIKLPLLIMHGADDANPGTTPLQADEALRGHSRQRRHRAPRDAAPRAALVRGDGVQRAARVRGCCAGSTRTSRMPRLAGRPRSRRHRPRRTLSVPYDIFFFFSWFSILETVMLSPVISPVRRTVCPAFSSRPEKSWFAMGMTLPSCTKTYLAPAFTQALVHSASVIFFPPCSMAALCEAPQLLSLIFPVHVCWAAQTGAEKEYGRGGADQERRQSLGLHIRSSTNSTARHEPPPLRPAAD